MTTDSFTKKGEARDTIVAAVVGILLAVGSYAIIFLLIGERGVELDLSKVAGVEPVEFQQTTGSVEACFTARRFNPDATERYNFCTGGHRDHVGEDSRFEVILYKLRNFDGSVGCDGVSRNDAETYDRDRCAGDGGELRSYPDHYGNPQQYCVREDTGECSDIMDSYSPEQACYDELRKHSTREERQYACDVHTASLSGQTLSETDLYLKIGGITDSACRGQDPNYVIEYAEEVCENEGGLFLTPEDTGLDTFICINPDPFCAEQVEAGPQIFPVSPLKQCATITADHGSRESGYPSHGGIDFAYGCGETQGRPIYPVYDGTVIHVGTSGRAARGYHVILEHELPDGRVIQTHYLHLKNNSSQLRVGDRVSAGSTKIGEVGNTGTSTSSTCNIHRGAHLHLTFATYPGGVETYHDPADFFDGDIDLMRGTLSSCI